MDDTKRSGLVRLKAPEQFIDFAQGLRNLADQIDKGEVPNIERVMVLVSQYDISPVVYGCGYTFRRDQVLGQLLMASMKIAQDDCVEPL